jgi:hypothetical protein
MFVIAGRVNGGFINTILANRAPELGRGAELYREVELARAIARARDAERLELERVARLPGWSEIPRLAWEGLLGRLSRLNRFPNLAGAAELALRGNQAGLIRLAPRYRLILVLQLIGFTLLFYFCD